MSNEISEGMDSSMDLLDSKPPAFTAGGVSMDEKLLEFENVLKSVSPEQKGAYLKAMERCPENVMNESRPLLFLRRHDFHVWNAAYAFLRYWDARLNVFGEERAFLPLNLTGKGALTEDDIAALKTCFTTLLPEHSTGSPVIMCSPHKSTSLSKDVIARTFFYIRNVAAMNPVASTHGYFGLIRYSPAWKQLVESEGFNRGLEAMQYIPITVRHLLLLVKPYDLDDGMRHIKEMQTRGDVWKKMHLITDDEGDELMEKLEAQGFSRQHIPSFSGGNLSGEQSLAWMQKFREGLKPSECFVSSRKEVAARFAAQTHLAAGTKTEWGMRVMEEALHFMVNNTEKEAYMEAIKIAPELVESESNPHKFLESSKFDGWEAAQKICKYWLYRQKWFGKKAFRPMTLNGKGALLPDDIHFAQQGMYQILPPDRMGRPVVITRSSGTQKGNTSLRSLFYFMQKICDNTLSRKNGFILLVHFVEGSGQIDEAKWTQALDFVWHAAPSCPFKVYLLLHTHGKDSKSFSRGQTLRLMFKSDTETVELTDDCDASLEKMRSIGLSRRAVPVELGGLWSNKDFLSWVDEQLASEETRDFSLYEEGLSVNSPQSVPSAGKTTPSGTTEEMSLFVAMEQALKMMDEEDAGEVLRARQEVPYLFAAETPPLRFLRAVDFNPKKAAAQLAAYWKKRRELFGTRAFLPLNLSKHGALDEKTIRVIKSGEMMLLPEDNAGRPVLYFSCEPDASHRGTFEARVQAFFYMIQVVSENPRSQTEGVVLLRKQIPSLFSSSKFGEIIGVGSAALPVKFYSHHVVCMMPPAGQQTYLESFTSRIYGYSSKFLTQTTNVHLTEADGEINELLEYDLRKEALPSSICGQWDDSSKWHRWIESRERREAKVQDRIFPKGVPEEKPDEPVSETVHVKEKALQALDEAISLMPDEEKKDYLEAKRLVPDLVLKESNPTWFIRCEKWNTWAASRRLTLYWRKRREIFEERAHLPMNQSGEGALSKEDVALLSTGYCCLLPRDSRGRDVVCHDATRKPPGMLQRRLRVLFYIGNMLSQNRRNQTEGNRFMVILSKISLDGDFGKTLEIAQNALPTRNFDTHIIHIPGGTSKATFMDKMVPVMMQFLGKFFEKQTVIHANETKSALLGRLESYNFKRDGLPVSVGGAWSYDQFYYWQEARIRMEWDLPLSTAQRKLVAEGDMYTCRGLSDLNDEEKAERKRRLNLLHSRRKREKEKVEIEVLKGQVSRLEDEKRESQMEHDRLEGLLRKARGMVPIFSRRLPKTEETPTLMMGNITANNYGYRPGPSAHNYGNAYHPQKAESVPQQRTPGVFSSAPLRGTGSETGAQTVDDARLRQILMSGNMQMQGIAGSFPGDYMRQQAPNPIGFAPSTFPTDPLNTSNSLSFIQQNMMQNDSSGHNGYTARYSGSESLRLDPTQAFKRQRL